MYCVNFAENALFVSFGSFADAKLLDFSPSDSTMTLHINGTLRTHALYTTADYCYISTCVRGVVVPVVILYRLAILQCAESFAQKCFILLITGSR